MGDFHEPELQNLDIEEADVKKILHINHSIKLKYENVYVVSSETEVIALLLYFFKRLQKMD